MAEFQAHVNHAKKNLLVLSKINGSVEDSWDWQVTVAYYVAVHIVNSHLAKVANLHYTTHEKVKTALYKPLSPVQVPQDIYLAYTKLENLSRRSRYLCNDTKPEESSVAYVTYDKHLKKALTKLDELLTYFSKIHSIEFSPIDVNCIELKALSLTYFNYQPAVTELKVS